MSGVFLTVIQQGVAPDKSILRTTKGGYPHITFVYTGNRVSPQDLLTLGNSVVRQIIGLSSSLPTFILTKENVVLNEFFEEKTRMNRIDVLLKLDNTGIALIDLIRTTHLSSNHTFHTNIPHVTHSIHYTTKDAAMARDKLIAKLPIVIELTGFTID